MENDLDDNDLSVNDLSVNDLLKQRKNCRIAISKMHNLLGVQGKIPEVDKASALHSEYEDIVLQLEQNNEEDDNVHMNKIHQIMKFINLYVQIDHQTARDISSPIMFNQCQSAINELNKMTSIFSSTFGLVFKLQSKLDSFRSLISSTSISMNPEANVGSNQSSTPLSGSAANVDLNRPPTPGDNANNSIVVADRSIQAIPSQGIIHNNQPLLNLSPITTNQSPPINNVLNFGQPMKIKPEEMPKFNGSAVQWPEFKEAALELIINNTFVPTATSKFRRLMGALPPEAQARIRDQRENPNFMNILNTLERYYGSPAVIIKELVNKIQSLPYLRLDAQPIVYAKYYELMINIRSIKLNDGDGRTILSHILSKFDIEHRRRAFNQSNNSNDQEYITLSNVEEYLRKITSTDMLINQITTTKSNRHVESHNTLVTSSNSDHDENEIKLTCIFCHQHHRHSSCLMSVNDKLEVLTKEKRCFRCTGKNHGTRECMKNYICHKCKGNHLSYLCQSAQNTASNNTTTAAAISSSSSTSVSSNSSTAINGEIQSINTALAMTDSSIQYLQTLTTKINNIKARVIFDGGSQVSFISSKLVKLLNLPKFEGVPIRINGYGENLSRLIGHYYTIIKFPDRYGHLSKFKLIIDDTINQFKFNALPEIVQRNVNKIFDINFNDETIPVDILFGNSDINRLKFLNVDKNIDPFIISKTSLGYIIHGQTDCPPSEIVKRIININNLRINSTTNYEDNKFTINNANNKFKHNENEKINQGKFSIINKNCIDQNFINKNHINSNFNNHIIPNNQQQSSNVQTTTSSIQINPHKLIRSSSKNVQFTNPSHHHSNTIQQQQSQSPSTTSTASSFKVQNLGKSSRPAKELTSPKNQPTTNKEKTSIKTDLAHKNSSTQQSTKINQRNPQQLINNQYYQQTSSSIPITSTTKSFQVKKQLSNCSVTATSATATKNQSIFRSNQLTNLSSTLTSTSPSSLSASTTTNSSPMMTEITNNQIASTIKQTSTSSTLSSTEKFWRDLYLKQLKLFHRFFSKYKHSKIDSKEVVQTYRIPLGHDIINVTVTTSHSRGEKLQPNMTK